MQRHAASTPNLPWRVLAHRGGAAGRFAITDSVTSGESPLRAPGARLPSQAAKFRHAPVPGTQAGTARSLDRRSNVLSHMPLEPHTGRGPA
jgi:hypothetical protein